MTLRNQYGNGRGFAPWYGDGVVTADAAANSSINMSFAGGGCQVAGKPTQTCWAEAVAAVKKVGLSSFVPNDVVLAPVGEQGGGLACGDQS